MTFHKDMSNQDQEEVYRRQEERAALLQQWVDSLQIKNGDHVLDLGSGPGYMSLQIAERVGRDGLVYAIDKSEQFISYLQQLLKERQITTVRPVIADILDFNNNDPAISAALFTLVLHHTDDPALIIQHVATLLPAKARAVIAEFHPEGPAEKGPPREHRIAPETIEQWCTQANLRVVSYLRQTEEIYMLLISH